jgi:hypothetical protein
VWGYELKKTTSAAVKCILLLTGQSKNCFAAMQGGGNFVLYDSGKPYWFVQNSANPGSYMMINDNANLVIYSQDGATVLWQINKSETC